jgi:omega-6 fatty acid desaturase (delta-12 desaturase)
VATSEYSARFWAGELEAYAKPRLSRSVVDLATSVVPYLAILVASYFAARVSVVLPFVLAIPASGFLTRTFIVFHDCTHGSFFRTKRANSWVGATLGILVWLPFRRWQHEHAIHHATSGDLDRRGLGDVTTLTIDEYFARPWWGRLGYRLFRNPLVMFGLGWMLVLVVKPRFVPRGTSRSVRNSILLTDLVLALVTAGLCLTIGWRAFLLVQGPVLVITGAAGIWLFYVQHQFEDAYWQTHDDWSYADAALHGSSYLKLPRLLQFFTGNIGFHHVHHLSARIPNYNLPAAHQTVEQLQAPPELSLWAAFHATRLKVWDEQRSRLVTFRDAEKARG